MDLIPPALIVNRYFKKEQDYIDQMTVTADDAARQIEEYAEEHTVEDGALADAMDDGKITKVLVTVRLKESKRDHGDPAEIKALEYLAKLFNAEASAKKLSKEAQSKLDSAVLGKYANLTEQDVKELVLDAKWQASIANGIPSEITKLTHNLVGRIKELGERYDETIGDLESEADELSAKVANHLVAMGVH